MKIRDRINLSSNKQERLYEGTKIWCDYYRQNIHIFAKQYLGLNLKPFQDVMMYAIQDNQMSVVIASRGKSLPIYIEIYK